MWYLITCLCCLFATATGDTKNQRTNPNCDRQTAYHHPVQTGVNATKYAVTHGELVLLGKVIFRPSYFCNTTKGLCGTRKIHLDVSCVLKGDGLPVADYISIGNDHYDPVCDHTLVPADLNGQVLIVIVKRDPHGVNSAYNFDWDEVIPQASAYLLSSDLNLVLQVCGIKPQLPTNTRKVGTCPQVPATDCAAGIPHSWIQVSDFGKYRISKGLRVTLHKARAICRALGARLLYVDRRSELEALLGALPTGSDMKWWTSGLIKNNQSYWEDYIYGNPIPSNVISWVHPNETLPENGHLLMTSQGWVTTINYTQELPFICKLPVDGAPVSFVPADFSSQMHLTVTYSMASYNRWICCQNVKYQEQLITSDNLTADMIQPYYMQKAPTLVLQGPGGQKSKYTYMMVDVTDPNSPYIHYLLTNAGRTPRAGMKGVIEYKPPLPINMRHYLFLAFKQVAGTVYLRPMAFSDSHCADRPRCKFYVSKFIEINGLQLVAVSPMTAELDAYTVQKLIDSKTMSITEACKRKWPNLKVVNKELVCPSSAAYTTNVTDGKSSGQKQVFNSFSLISSFLTISIGFLGTSYL